MSNFSFSPLWALTLPSFRGTFGMISEGFPKVGLALLQWAKDLFNLHSADAALDTTRLGQAIVMVHQEVAFDLLQGIEHNTHENQQ